MNVSVSAVCGWSAARRCRCGGYIVRRKSPVCVTCRNRDLGVARKRWTRDAILSAIVSFYAEHGRAPSAEEWRKSTGDHPNTTTVLLAFSTWSNAIRESGLKPRRPGQHTWTTRPEKVEPTVANGFSHEEEMAYLVEQQARDSRTTQLQYDLSLDAPYGLALTGLGSLHQAVADERLEELLDAIDSEFAA